MGMPSAVREMSRFSKSVPLSTASTRLRQSLSLADGNSEARGRHGDKPASDIAAESRDGARHLLYEIIARYFLGIG